MIKQIKIQQQEQEEKDNDFVDIIREEENNRANNIRRELLKFPQKRNRFVTLPSVVRVI